MCWPSSSRQHGWSAYRLVECWWSWHFLLDAQMYVLPDALKGNTWAEMLRESVLYLVLLIFEQKITWWLMP